MSNDADALRAEFLETLYAKTASEGSWQDKGNDSFETFVEDLKIQLDKGAVGDRVAYSVWIWGKAGLIDNIYDDDMKTVKPKLPEFENYGQLIRHMFERAQNTIVLDRIKGALETLRSGAIRGEQ